MHPISITFNKLRWVINIVANNIATVNIYHYLRFLHFKFNMVAICFKMVTVGSWLIELYNYRVLWVGLIQNLGFLVAEWQASRPCIQGFPDSNHPRKLRVFGSLSPLHSVFIATLVISYLFQLSLTYSEWGKHFLSVFEKKSWKCKWVLTVQEIMQRALLQLADKWVHRLTCWCGKK